MAGGNRPLGFGPVLRVPTDGPVELGPVVEWVRRHWPNRLGTAAGVPEDQPGPGWDNPG